MSDEDLRDLYRELILDHSRKPRHFGRLPDATHTADGINPLCGDKLRLYLKVEDGTISSLGFEATGCAISVASASLMADAIEGLGVESAESCFASVTDRLTGGTSDLGAPLEKLAALDGVRDYPSRVKCATLAWHALHAALTEDPNPATTE
ncbi:MAG: SUF system NifU family Fe-S cluster assembly protein [Woeseiaceae bacterium]|nr:SUF system NifU family Fe-S cluster assembly protein [Woeseiaceae bacterium]